VVIPDALLLITGGCPHCPAMHQALTGLLKEGVIGRLEVINVAVHTEAAEERNVQSVPWTKIGPYEIQGVVPTSELKRYAQGVDNEAVFDAYVLDLLKTGKRARFEALVKHEPKRIHALARLMTNPETSMAIRLGIGAVLEEFQGTGLTQPLVPELGVLLNSDDPLLRADACHFLTLIGGEEVRPYMEACLNRTDAELHEMAQEWLGESSQEAQLIRHREE
jgi:thiol-disulfide isomerase/thioredoxin